MERSQVEVADWESKAELAISKEREDLARLALVEKKKSADQATSLGQDLARIDEHLQRLNDEIGQVQEKLADAKARQKSIVMRQRSASTRLEVKKRLDS